MDLLSSSFSAIVVLIGMRAIGFYIIAKNIVSTQLLKLMSSLAIEVAMPLFIFTNLMKNFDPGVYSGWWKLPLWWVFFAFVTLIMTVVSSFLFRKDFRRESRVALYLHNPTFVPLSIIIGVYGSSSPYVIDLILFTLFTSAFYFNFYKLFFRNIPVIGSGSVTAETVSPAAEHKPRLDWNKIFNPFIKATFLALFIKLTGLTEYVPAFVLSTTEQVGNIAFPLIMIILGGNVYIDMKSAGRIYVTEIIKYVALKNLLFPLVMLGIIYLLRPSYGVALVLLLQSASPPLSTVPVLIQRQGGHMGIGNQFLVVSFFLTIVTIPLMMILFNRIY